MRHRGNKRVIRKFFIKERVNARRKLKGLPGCNRTVSRGLPSTGIMAEAVTTLRPRRALPGVAPPVLPTLLLKQKA